MGLVTCLVLVLCAHLVFTSPETQSCRKRARTCPKCPAGQYLKKCACEHCPAETYTSDTNCEASCHLCYSDCISDLHLKVVQNCTSRSNLQCECEDGFVCVDRETVSGNCKHCQKIHDKITSDGSETRSSSAPTGQSSTSTPPCNFPKCSSPPISGNSSATQTGTTNTQLAAILCPLVVGGVAVVILFCVGCAGDETCFKQTVKKLCNVEVKDAPHKPRESFCAKKQPVPVAAANMGSVHVHNPGTVIISLLSQFTGQIGSTKEQKTDISISCEDEDTDCSVCPPTPSSSTHLSEEEHRGEADRIFFPSQEHGKDCRVSKEEVL